MTTKIRQFFKVFLFIIAVNQFFISALYASDMDKKLRFWGKTIQGSLKDGSIDTLVIDASTNKKGPSRVVNVIQYHTDRKEIDSILGPVAEILKNGEYELTDQQNLAVTIVTFDFEPGQLCNKGEGKFSVRSAGNSVFYMGCTDSVNMQGNNGLIIIKSKKLYDSLYSFFPKEILH